MQSNRPMLRWRLLALCGAAPAFSAPPAGDLLLSRSVYEGTASTVTIGQKLPGGGAKLAVADGSYPAVWNNEAQDPSFGVTSPIYLDRHAVVGSGMGLVSTWAVPTSQLVTSFPSKSELALSLSTDGHSVTFMGYPAPVNALDVSNSNTPNHVDPTNPVALVYPRAVAQIDATGHNSTVQVTPVNTYSGNNGRAAILDAADNLFFMVGNAGNGSGTEPASVVQNTGVQLVQPGLGGESTVVGIQQGVPGSANGYEFGFSVAQLGYAADKSGKDDNFRGMTIHNHTLYVTKGSGGNGVNTVYQVGTTGTLPTAATASSTPISILPGFSTTLAKSTTAVVSNPFGIWFADDSTLYVADEGDGTTATAATNPRAGLEKWVLEADGIWHNVYTLQNGLSLGIRYAVPGLDSSLSPAPAGLRSLTGRINGDGSVTLWSVTSTVSAAVDQGADPNQLVTITDTLAFRSPSQAAAERFALLRTARFAEALRGVSFVPLSAPVAVPGPDQAISVGQTVQLDGSGSYEDNAPSTSLGYTWSLISAPPGSAAALSDVHSSRPNFNADLPGDYVVGLVVLDSATGLASAPSQVVVSSVWAVPVANAGPDRATLVGQALLISGSGTDPQGLALAYSWTLLPNPAGGAAGLSNDSISTPSFLATRAGTYKLSLVVNDRIGSSVPDTAVVTVVTAADYASRRILEGIEFLGSLPPSDFDVPQHRRLLQQILADALEDIRRGRISEARADLLAFGSRIDGVPLRGSVDLDGPGRDWIMDPATQTTLYQGGVDVLRALALAPQGRR